MEINLFYDLTLDDSNYFKSKHQINSFIYSFSPLCGIITKEKKWALINYLLPI